MAPPARVVITGIGPVTPIGTGVRAYWDYLRCGRSGVAPITAFDASALKVRIAAELRIDRGDGERLGRLIGVQQPGEVRLQRLQEGGIVFR